MYSVWLVTNSKNSFCYRPENEVFEESIANKFDLLDQMEKQQSSSEDEAVTDPAELEDLEDHLAIMAKVLGNKVLKP